VPADLHFCEQCRRIAPITGYGSVKINPSALKSGSADSLAPEVQKNRPIGTGSSYIHEHRLWCGEESVSGPGSDTQQTATLVRELPLLLDRYQIRSILDIPCGDFHWMKRALPDGIDYLGGDIVDVLISTNRSYENACVQFKSINLLTDTLPPADLLICRDCLVHLSFAHIRQAFRQIARSDFRYLLFSHFPKTGDNRDIPTGLWRPLNLIAAPFHFPPPIKMIVEECKEVAGSFEDKSLALWRKEDLLQALLKF